MPRARAKICGLTDRSGLDAAVNGGAGYVGFVFFAKSPRHLGIEAARTLAVEVPPGVIKVALAVNADNATLDAIDAVVPIDMWQLHGSESPARVAEVKARFGLPVMKALGVADADDVSAIADYAQIADQILVDAKPPTGAVSPGGNGLSFDWRLLSTHRWSVPWMLAGGLTPDNVHEAIALTGAAQVDVSSGVETAPGVKAPHLISAFLAGCRGKVAPQP